jgi:hypothetical protein
MPSLFRFLAIVGVVGGFTAVGLYVLAEFFQPAPKETTTTVPGVKVRK